MDLNEMCINIDNANLSIIENKLNNDIFRLRI